MSTSKNQLWQSLIKNLQWHRKRKRTTPLTKNQLWRISDLQPQADSLICHKIWNQVFKKVYDSVDNQIKRRVRFQIDNGIRGQIKGLLEEMYSHKR